MWYILDYLSDAWFLIDIIMNLFFFAFVEEGNIVTSRKTIRAHYLRGWFFIDVFSVLPVDFIAFLTRPELQPWMRLNRILRFARILHYFGQIEEYMENNKTKVNSALFRSMKLCIVILQVMHWIACTWFIMTFDVSSFQTFFPLFLLLFYINDIDFKIIIINKNLRVKGVGLVDFVWSPENWAGRDGIDNSPLYRQYLRSTYWGLGALMIVYCGDIIPGNYKETFTMVSVMIGGITLYAGFVANLAALVSNLDKHTKSVYEKVQSLHQYLKNEVN